MENWIKALAPLHKEVVLMPYGFISIFGFVAAVACWIIPMTDQSDRVIGSLFFVMVALDMLANGRQEHFINWISDELPKKKAPAEEVAFDLKMKTFTHTTRHIRWMATGVFALLSLYLADKVFG